MRGTLRGVGGAWPWLGRGQRSLGRAGPVGGAPRHLLDGTRAPLLRGQGCSTDTRGEKVIFFSLMRKYWGFEMTSFDL